eukprot:1137343-Pelagomonas_calceolata.AAC.7
MDAAFMNFKKQLSLDYKAVYIALRSGNAPSSSICTSDCAELTELRYVCITHGTCTSSSPHMADCTEPRQTFSHPIWTS